LFQPVLQDFWTRTVRHWLYPAAQRFHGGSLWLLGIYELAPEAVDLSKIDVVARDNRIRPGGVARRHDPGSAEWLIYRVLRAMGSGTRSASCGGRSDAGALPRLQKKAEKLERRSLKEPRTPGLLEGQRREVLTKLAQRFPERKWILPTSLGNIIRAF